VLALTAVSGCSDSFNPGAAATVNGTAIPQSKVDSVVSAACAYTAAIANGQAGQPTSLANLRLTITQAQIQFALTGEVSDEMGLTVSPAAVHAADTQNTVPSGLSHSDAAALTDFFYDYAKSATETQLINAHLGDPSITTSAQVTKPSTAAAAKYLAGYAAKQDITVNPAYGRWTGSGVVGGSGSLSDAVTSSAKDSLLAATSSQANTSDLLPTQVC
jgi:hypothetical protein